MKMRITPIVSVILLSACLPLKADDNHMTPVNNQDYTAECSGCHFAYQPGLLPARSWQKLMGNLQDHFGDNAELDAAMQKSLTDYLTQNAAEFSKDEFSRKLLWGLSKNSTPLRISELGYFTKEHDEIPEKMVEGNPDVKSFSQCDKCHTEAEKGDYTEETISIPGYGAWDD